jgi:hypothetical protein
MQYSSINSKVSVAHVDMNEHAASSSAKCHAHIHVDAVLQQLLDPGGRLIIAHFPQVAPHRRLLGDDLPQHDAKAAPSRFYH